MLFTGSIYLLERAEDRADAYNAAYQQLLASPAFLQLSVSMLLLHCFSAQQRNDSGGGSSGSGSSSGSPAGGGSSGSNAGGTSTKGSTAASSNSGSSGSSSHSTSAGEPEPCMAATSGSSDSDSSGKSSSASSNSNSGSRAGTPPEKDMQILRDEQTYCTSELWHSCGFVPSALPAFAVAAGSMQPSLLLPQSHGFSVLSHRKFIMLPNSAPAMHQGFVLAAAAVSTSVEVAVTDAEPQDVVQRFRVQLCLKEAGELHQEQRQLLQQVVWLLPPLLLLTAWMLTCDSSSSNSSSLDTVVQSAVDAAANAVAVWSMPGLPLPNPDAADAPCEGETAACTSQVPPAATGAAAAPAVAAAPLDAVPGTGAGNGAWEPATTNPAAADVGPAAEAAAEEAHWRALRAAEYEYSLLLPMFDCWVQLMQQQLLRPSTGLLLQAAPSRSLPAARTQGQQRQQVGKVCGLQSCRCSSVWSPAQRSSISYRSLSLSCTQQQVVALLLVLLERMKDRSMQAYSSQDAHGMAEQMWGLWFSKVPAVMLSVEGLLRRILPATILGDKFEGAQYSHGSCNATSSSTKGSSSSAGIGSACNDSSRVDSSIRSGSSSSRASSAAAVLRESFMACLSKKQYQNRVERTLLSVITDPTPGRSMAHRTARSRGKSLQLV